MTSSLKTVKTRKGMTATSQRAKARPEQVKNAAGGYTFKIDDLDRVKRFLILGAETNFYTPGAKLALENADTIRRVVSTPEGARAVVDLIVEYSTQGRAPKQDAGLFALAIASSPESGDSKYALAALPKVARTGTTLIQFVGFALQFRGWGRAFKRAVADWYTAKDVDKTALQVTKYRQREGWTHRDLFRTSHPVSQDEKFQALGEFVLKGAVSGKTPDIIQGFVRAQAPGADVPALVREYGLSWEMIPTESLNDRKVWDALLDSNVPLGALIRQLPRLTNLGFFEKLKSGSRLGEIVKRLTNKAEIERARIHPIKVLEALKTYQSGRSAKGSTTWTPSREIVDALDKAFYLAFKNVTPAGKKFLIGLDVSGSMDGGYYYGNTNPTSVLTPREATAAIAMVTAATEPETHIVGFTSYAGGSSGYGYWGRQRSSVSATKAKDHYSQAVTDLDTIVSPSRRLDDVISDVRRLPMGGTDIAVPIMYALEKGLRPDVFLILTDNETWAGDIQPFEALEKYRRETGVDAKVIFLSTEATKNTLIDPKDKNSLDIAGFDSAAPQLIASFARGEF